LLEIGSKKKLIIGMFLLSSIILMGYNGFKFMALYDRPLTGASLESRLASDKWGRLEELLLSKKNINWNEYIENFIKEIPAQEVKLEETVPVVTNTQVQAQDSDVLPAVTGIMNILDSDGKSHIAVIINNRFFNENETISGFVIKEITEKGIYLTKGKRSWFVETPMVSYSVDRGD
jgi:hypothetical protein